MYSASEPGFIKRVPVGKKKVQCVLKLALHNLNSEMIFQKFMIDEISLLV